MAKKKATRAAAHSDSRTASRAKSPTQRLSRQTKTSRNVQSDKSFLWASPRPRNDEHAIVSPGSKPKDKGHIATLEEFDWCSRAIASLFHDFGMPDRIEGVLIAVAMLGPLKTAWVAPWSERIVSLLNKDKDGGVEPVTIRPFAGSAENENAKFSDRCANYTAVWLVTLLWDYLFPEHPHFDHENKRELPSYIGERFDVLEQRVSELAKQINHQEWLELAAKMQIERYLLRQSFEPRWSRPGTMKDWPAWHRKANCSGSWDSIKRWLRKGVYVEKLPRIKGQIILDINKLPLKMQSEEFWNSLPARTTHNSASDKNTHS